MKKLKIMDLTSAAIIISNNPVQIDNCLSHVANQTVPFSRILVVAWGQENLKQQVIQKAVSVISNAEIIDPDNDTRLENNRNKAISHLIEKPTDRVAFLDDDTLIENNWLEVMRCAAMQDGDKISHATVVKFNSQPFCIQSAGHCLDNASPLDLAYGKCINFPITAIPLCPCGNSAYIPWRALVDIHDRDQEIWDPDFDQWVTCFDFGLKLQLCGYGCKLVPSAFATHQGYLDKSIRNQKLCKNKVMKQLRSRLLLYFKFYPSPDRESATDQLNKSLDRWRINGYPHAEAEIKGEKLVELFCSARIGAKKLAKTKSKIWLELMSNLVSSQRRNLLFGNKY